APLSGSPASTGANAPRDVRPIGERPVEAVEESHVEAGNADDPGHRRPAAGEQQCQTTRAPDASLARGWMAMPPDRSPPSIVGWRAFAFFFLPRLRGRIEVG